MTFSTLRLAAAGALALALAACGGKATFEVAGTITGLTNSGLKLSMGGTEISPPANATSFKFPNHVEYGNTYTVTPAAQPSHQACSVAGGSGTAGQLATITVSVTCNQNSYAIGGTVSGYPTGATGSLLLTNGSQGGTVLVPAGVSTFTFGTKVPDGSAYGVTVLTHPTGLKCSVTNGTGIMGEAAVTNMVVTCTAA